MDIERRVKDAKIALDRVLEEQRQVKEDMNAVHDPMNWLPIEISSDIFGLCFAPIPRLEGQDNIRDYSRMHTQDPTFQLKLGAEWLSRSADLSLIIWLEYEHQSDYDSDSDDEADVELGSAGLALLDAVRAYSVVYVVLSGAPVLG
ncbi:hypothetical protein CPB83DRAFT_831630 [Crepidotus variabilis]|uniref:Uncharacterized protein n=1 Tax=Crepidotus variabilis TaxID=179855 RepID=A0A9P6EPT8_9AGAR|nr:hypothetical protein CPB83DRAFT_831630 [Crepidotus variabilis]